MLKSTYKSPVTNKVRSIEDCVYETANLLACSIYFSIYKNKLLMEKYAIKIKQYKKVINQNSPIE